MRSDLAAAALALALAAPPSADGFRPAPPDHRWAFPRDHWAHPGFRNEWWYLTGIVASDDEPGRRFGWQLTFFRVGLVPERPALDSAWAASDAVMVHAAVTDLASGAHVFSEVFWRAAPPLGGFGVHPDPVIAWARAPAGTEGRWTLAYEEGSFRISGGAGAALRLVATPEKPPALQGPNGLSRKAREEGYASLYYSVTRLATAGTLVAGGRTHRVRGEGWLDHEVGSSQLAPQQVGWDWFALRLDDGRDLMLYLLRRADGAIDFATGTVVARDGTVALLGAGAWTVRARGRWRSPATGADYPSGWDVEVPSEGISLRVDPEAVAAENRSTLAGGLFYWEGPVRVTDAAGRRRGEGYVELTGHGAGSRPPI
jgi:predicted secreted hydrolase